MTPSDTGDATPPVSVIEPIVAEVPIPGVVTVDVAPTTIETVAPEPGKESAGGTTTE